MAMWKCTNCGATKESRCKPKKCANCGTMDSMAKVETGPEEGMEKKCKSGKGSCRKKAS